MGGIRVRGKNYNLEFVRIISFVLVIAIHVTNYYCRAYGEVSQGEYLFSLIIDAIARISVPCFFMISGALLLGREESLEKQGNRLLRFIIVLAIWSLIYYLWNTFFMKTSYDLTQILYRPVEAHLWYLYAMIPIYVVLPFLQIMCRGMSMKLDRAFFFVSTLAILFNFGLYLADAEAYYDMPLIGDRIYMYYVFIGYFIYKYRKHITISPGILMTVATFCMTTVIGLTWFITIKMGAHYEDLLTYGNPLIALTAMAFFLFMIRLKNGNISVGTKCEKVVKLLGECSFGIYLIHILFLDAYKKYVSPSQWSAWFAVPILLIAICFLSLVSVWLVRKTKLGRKLT